jgi:aminoglycoside phosphotransferase
VAVVDDARVSEWLVIDDGPAIELQGRPAQGTQHDVHFGVLSDTQQPVVVKLERIPGALERERVALAWLGAHRGPAPRLLAGGGALLAGARVVCLITERCHGAAPISLDGWSRMSRAHAHLAGLRVPCSGLPILDPIAFGQRHTQRVSDLGTRLDQLSRSIPDWAQLISPEIPGPAPLVITHGDPGPGNYLDNDNHGTLIDWENAHVAPRGLDIARLVFIALLGAGPEGYHARDHHARAKAAITGYLSALSDNWLPSHQQSRWWTTVAGIQFIHRRWQRHGQPAPWQDATTVLQRALTSELDWLST